MRIKATAPFFIRKESGFAMTQDRSTQPDFPTSTSFAADFLARVSRSPDTEKALRTLAERCFSRLPEYLEPKSPLLFCLKTYPDCYRMTKGGPSPSSSGRFLGWGIMSNGRCLTARILASPNHGSACSLSGILERDVPEKYYLSSAQMERLLFKSSEARKACASTTQKE